MKISIIIPIYNVETYIKRCLHSVSQQTYKDIEVILIDDCGKDKSIEITKKHIERSRDPNKYKIIHHERNRGLSAARNTGIRHATGQYIYFLDSDDEIISTCIEKLVSLAKVHDVDFVMGDHTRTGILVPHKPHKLKLALIDSNDGILHAHFSRQLYVMAWNRLVKTDFIKKHKLFFQEGIFYEDVLWSFMVACKATRIFVTNDRTYLYTIRSGSITQNITVEHYLSQLKIIRGLVSFVNTDPRLVSRANIYNYIEELKSTYFFDLLLVKLPRQFKLNYYISLRNDTYLKKNGFVKINELSVPQIIRNIHYILPIPLGYHYYQLSLRMKKWLKM